MASVATQLPTLIRVMMSVWKPKVKMDRISGGIKQATTVHMIFSTDSPLFIWGEMDTVHKEGSVAETEVSFTCSSMALLLTSRSISWPSSWPGGRTAQGVFWQDTQRSSIHTQNTRTRRIVKYPQHAPLQRKFLSHWEKDP